MTTLYPITPEADEKLNNPDGCNWDFIKLVDEFQEEMPEENAIKARAAEEASESMFAVAINQKAVAKTDEAPKDMVVEFTQGFIKVPYLEFIEKLSIDKWGYGNLAHWLGGELRPEEGSEITTGEDKEARQIERMYFDSFNLNPKTVLDKGVLAFIAKTIQHKPINLDMTKREIYRISKDSSKVYWQVFYSDNGTVNDDIGSLEFKTHNNGTLVTFHSAHHLAVQEWPDPLQIISKKFVPAMLSQFFQDSVEKYREIVSK